MNESTETVLLLIRTGQIEAAVTEWAHISKKPIAVARAEVNAAKAILQGVKNDQKRPPGGNNPPRNVPHAEKPRASTLPPSGSGPGDSDKSGTP